MRTASNTHQQNPKKIRLSVLSILQIAVALNTVVNWNLTDKPTNECRSAISQLHIIRRVLRKSKTNLHGGTAQTAPGKTLTTVPQEAGGGEAIAIAAEMVGVGTTLNIVDACPQCINGRP